MEQNITYNIEELHQQLEERLDELGALRRNERLSALLGAPFMTKVKEWESSIRRQKDIPFTIVVCGEFKRGKSSLINALLGEDVVTTDVTTETITLNRVCYGEHSNALVLAGGKRMLLTDQQLCRSELERILAQSKETSYQLELKRPIEFLKDVTIIDTPGLNDSLLEFDDMVADALMQADAVVYVFSVVYPLSGREQLFLKTSVLPQKHTELFVVGNYTDMLANPAQLERMQQEIRTRMDTLLPGQRVYMLSALDERCRQLEEERPNDTLQKQLEEEFCSFRKQVADLIQEKKDMVLPDRMERMMSGMREELGQELDVIEHGATIQQDALSKEQQSAKQTCDEIFAKQNETLHALSQRIELMEGDSLLWLSELAEQMRTESCHLDDIDLEDIRKYYAIYCIDTLQEALNRCMDYHTDLLYDDLDKISEELSRKSALKPSTPQHSFHFKMNNKTWTKGDNVSFVINQTQLGSSLVGVFATGVAGGMRQREMKNSRKSVIADIQQQYDKLSVTLPATVKRTYDQFARQIQEQLHTYFSDCVSKTQQQTEQLLEIAHRAADEKEEILQAIRSVRSLLDEIAG
ncbi:dynamin family protein [Pseudoflavonifractor phocaeensis]|uniref:dynamin family protein n=1 Tax=Pseudoflavonifractor phocaeensis TaxID=1870988 RepID=UPI00195BF833|nr:dynamin family protein [Pseudoflavonifractor phocaeensis]MBM6937018.1 dynamin family protein [Pseudoflavonifractor phocaeensis]